MQGLSVVSVSISDYILSWLSDLWDCYYLSYMEGDVFS